MRRPADLVNSQHATSSAPLGRRAMLQRIALCGSGMVLGSALADAQPRASAAAPLSTISSPPRDFGPDAPPTTYYLDPDIVLEDPSFLEFVQPNTPLLRLWTGALWAEGPAWNAQGRFLVWSDIPNNRQMRWLEDDGHVSIFRLPANNSNGNCYDFEGRQVSCEHLTRRVVRYELDGSVTVLADRFEGKRLNSPNDIVAHPDGSYWFTDSPFGSSLYEGTPDRRGAPGNPAGRLDPALGTPPGFSEFARELPPSCYRIATDGRVEAKLADTDLVNPNGLCFSPDYKTLYVVSTPASIGKGEIYAFDVGPGGRLANKQLFSECLVDGVKCYPDSVRCDVAGNLWCSSNAAQAVGYSGVHIYSPQAKLIGRVRLPESCGNLCFGGPKRNRLFIAASRSIYALYVNTQGAAPS